MIGFARKFLKRDKGIATVELALVTPIFLMLFLSMIELGHMIYYSIAVEKALRSAATYAGRNEVLDAAIITKIENIAKTGNPNGGEYVVRGWSDPDANVTVTTSDYFVDMGGGNEDLNEVVYKITVEVPYLPIVDALVPALDYLMRNSVKDDKIMLVLSQEQAMIGD